METENKGKLKGGRHKDSTIERSDNIRAEVLHAMLEGDIGFRQRIVEKYNLAPSSIYNYTDWAQKYITEHLSGNKDEQISVIQQKIQKWIEILESRNDYKEAGKMLDRLVKLKGLAAPEEVKHEHQVIQVNFVKKDKDGDNPS